MRICPLKIVYAMAFSTLVACCSGCGNGDSPPFVQQETYLRLTFVEEPFTGAPLPAVTAVLHGDDQRSVARVLESDARGVVDFGDTGRVSHTFTIAYQSIMEGWDLTFRVLRTFVDVPGGDLFLALGLPSWEEAAPLARINVRATEMPPGIAQMGLQPFNHFLSDPLEFDFQYEDVEVFDRHVQNDGNLSLLLTGFGQDHGMVKYGFLLDQPLEDGRTYTIPLERNPLRLPWETRPPVPVFFIFLDGVYRGVDFPLGGAPNEQGAGSGEFLLPSSFPMGSRSVRAAGRRSGDTRVSMIEKLPALPPLLSVSMPDYRFDTATCDLIEGTCRWIVSGSTGRDAMALMLAYDAGDILTHWTWWVNPEPGEISMVDLPERLRGWVDSQYLVAGEFGVVDMNDVNGFEDFWRHAVNPGLSRNVPTRTSYGYHPVDFKGNRLRAEARVPSNVDSWAGNPCAAGRFAWAANPSCFPARDKGHEVSGRKMP